MMTRTTPIRDKRLDFQPEEYSIDFKIIEFADAMSDGNSFPPVVVYFDGETYWLADGFHRVRAGLSMGLREIDAEIVPGTYADLCAEHERMHAALLADLRKGKQ